SALDKKLREQMQFEISRLHRQLGCTMVYVTHDQAEALTMSDRIAVFNHGVVQQYATPDVLYEQPANAFVAGFIGENNLMPGTGSLNADGTVSVTLRDGTRLQAAHGDFREKDAPCVLSVRPVKPGILIEDTPAAAHTNVLSARLVTQHYVGDFIRYFFELADGTRIVVKTMNDDRAPRLAEGQPAKLFWSMQYSFAFHPTPTPAVQGDTPGRSSVPYALRSWPAAWPRAHLPLPREPLQSVHSEGPTAGPNKSTKSTTPARPPPPKA